MSPVRRASHGTFLSYRGVFSYCGVFSYRGVLRLHIDLRRVAAALCSA